MQALAREAFGHGQGVLKKYLLTGQDAGQVGMVCGGWLRSWCNSWTQPNLVI